MTGPKRLRGSLGDITGAIAEQSEKATPPAAQGTSQTDNLKTANALAANAPGANAPGAPPVGAMVGAGVVGATALLLGSDIGKELAAAVGAMSAGAAVHLAERDADQQAPQVAVLAEQDFPALGQQEEAAVGRLDHVLGVHVDLAGRMDLSHLRSLLDECVQARRPVLAVVALFHFLHAWNDFLGPLIYLNTQDKYTLTIGLQVFLQQNSTQFQYLMAISFLMSLPIIVVFFFAQQHFVRGIVMSGIKG